MTQLKQIPAKISTTPLKMMCVPWFLPCGMKDGGYWILGIRTWLLCSIGKSNCLKSKIDPPLELDVVNYD